MRKYHNIPPLRALKAFEASARHLSFTKAADELCVTQAAISHQIKSLEEKTKTQLFKRYNRSLQLTSAGQVYLLSIIESLNQLEKSSKQLAGRNSRNTLSISLLPSFATKWMAQRIWRFQDQFPEIEVRITACDSLVDFNQDESDIAIRYGRGNWDNVFSMLLFEEQVFPICSRETYENIKLNIHPSILLTQRLVLDDFSSEDWEAWFKKADICLETPIRGTRFSHTVMMLESIENGRGFALGRTPLVIDDLKRNIFYAPFDIYIPSDFAYYFVCKNGQENNPKIAAFKEWVSTEAKLSKRQANDFFASKIN